MSVFDTLTEGIRQRMLSSEGEALLHKWERTGLLEGLDEVKSNNMARLLENQAAQLLKETSTMAAGDVEGFSAVAFPIVRRVFGGLLAQDLVSVQPMSLPSGLIFFLDFVYSQDGGMISSGGTPASLDSASTRLGNMANLSIYGGDVVASGIDQGINLDGANTQKGFYNLNDGFASPTGTVAAGTVVAPDVHLGSSGTFGDANTLPGGKFYELLRSDPALVSGTSTYMIAEFPVLALVNQGFDPTGSQGPLNEIVLSGSDGIGGLETGAYVNRSLTRFSSSDGANPTENKAVIQIVGVSPAATRTADQLQASVLTDDVLYFPIKDNFVAGTALGSVVGASPWGLEAQDKLPEIDIKVDSKAVTAVTKKLKAKWSPELAQDLNAYHNLDAEVELTSILSEQIALEIDQEILADLVKGGTGGTLWWSRRPGRFVDRELGSDLTVSNGAPDFTGTVSEWYETLLETINDLSARIHRKTLRGGANFIVCSPEVASILEFTSGFRASVENDGDRGTWGAMKAGSLSKKMDIYVDPYFVRNLILVGRRGSSFLESGFVYAPYVPLQVTPTIFGTEDFVPRKGVMTRYAKSMVRPDMYGLVCVRDLVG
jgi:hypothetical protein